MKAHGIKLLLFLVLLGGFCLFGGFQKPQFNEGSAKNNAMLSLAWTCCVALYCGGAISALWGRQTIGSFHPISLRPLYVVVGVLAMAGALAYMTSLKWIGSQRGPVPNQPAAGNAGIASRLTIGCHSPGVPEPGR